MSFSKFRHQLSAVFLPFLVASISAGCQIRVMPPSLELPPAQAEPVPDDSEPAQSITHTCKAIVPEPVSDEVVTVDFDFPLPSDADITTVQLTILGEPYAQKALFSTAGEDGWWVMPVIRGIAPMVITQGASRGPADENLTAQFYGYEEIPAVCQPVVSYTPLP